MNFYVGQEVLCIKTHSGNLVKKGEKFVIDGMKKGCNHYPLLLDVGVKTEDYNGCRLCNTPADPPGIMWFGSSLFAPIDNTLSETTVEELLNEPQPC